MGSGEPAAPVAPMRRRWSSLLVGLVVGAGGAVVAQQLLEQSEHDAQATAEPVELDTVAVTTADLIEEVEWEGVLDYSGRTAVIGSGGTITDAVGPGTELGQGDLVVEIDARPMVAFYGDTPMYRTMEQDLEGPDVFVLESNLVELGYDPDTTVTIDESFSYNTELMVQRWQEDLGLEATGVVEVTDVIVVDGPVMTLEAPVVGSPATGTLLNLAPRSERVVTVPVAVADADEWEAATTVAVVLADESEREGTVSLIGTAITSDQDGSTVDVSIVLDGDTEGLLEGPVVVRTVGSEIVDATVVPTRALVALAEGGFAVEKSDGAATRQLVAVEIGAFDDGLVEVTAGEVSPGDLVVVPR